MRSKGSRGWEFSSADVGVSSIIKGRDVQYVQCVQKVQEVGNFRLPMLVFSPIIKGRDVKYVKWVSSKGWEFRSLSKSPSLFLIFSFLFIIYFQNEGQETIRNNYFLNL